jgi:NDP-sugar pyrophosphorylase family protein
MTVFANEGHWDTSNVFFRDGEIVAYDKKNPGPEMKHIDYGLGVLSAEVLKRWAEDEPFDLADVYQLLTAENQLAGYEVTERFYEIGSPQGLTELDALLRTRQAVVTP